ncbi:MAG: hypothetical protein ACK4WA_07395, partial [Chitinophagales bacterium]
NNNAVTGAKILDATVDSADIATNAIRTGHINNNAVTGAKILDATVDSADINAGSIRTSHIANIAVTTPKLADLSVSNDKLQNGSVTLVKLADNAVNSAKIIDGEVDSADVKLNAVRNSHIINGAVDTSKVRSGGNDKLLSTNGSGVVTWMNKNGLGAVADQITIQGAGTAADSFKVKDLGINTAKLFDSAVTSDKLRDLNVTTAKLADNAVTGAKIQDGQVDSADINTNAVRTGHISNLAVTIAKLADNAVTGAKIQDGQVDSAELATDAVRNIHIKANAVTTAKIANAAVDTSKIAGNGNNKVLATDGAGVVRWIDKTAVGNSVSDGISIVGTGAVGDSLKVKNGSIDSIKIAANGVRPIHIKGDAEKILVSQGGLTKWVTRLAPGESTVGSVGPPLYNIAAPAADYLMVKVACTGGVGTCNIATFSVPAGKVGSFISTGGVWEIIGIF